MKKQDLIKDLEKLNEKYTELERKVDLSFEKENFHEEYGILMKQKGQVVVDFYNETFIPNYSKMKNEYIRDVDNFLLYYSSKAKYSIAKENYFSLGVLFSQSGSMIADPNELEKLIEEIK